MPYIYYENGKKYMIPRTTEIASALVCENTAYLHPLNKMKNNNWNKISTSNKVRYNLKAISGTIVHNKIENFIRKKIGLTQEELSLSSNEMKMINKLMKNKQRFTIFMDEVERTFNNFLQFWDDYKDMIKVIATEKKLRHIVRNKNGEINEYESFSGTIDLLTLFKTDYGWRTLIVDWKTSATPLPSHHIQLCGYYILLTSSEFYKKDMKNLLKKAPYYHMNNPYALCVLLGGRKYVAKWYEIKTEMFRKAQRKFRDPTPLTKNEITKNIGLQKFCMVCSYVTQCYEYDSFEENENTLPKIKQLEINDKEVIEVINKIEETMDYR